MILSRKAIREAIGKGAVTIQPFSEDHIDKAHIDLHLAKLYGNKKRLVIPPKSFSIATTEEKITLSDQVCGFIEGRASLAKQGISVEQSSTFIEPGSNNQMTLEIFNASDKTVRLEAGQPIAKMYLLKITDTF